MNLSIEGLCRERHHSRANPRTSRHLLWRHGRRLKSPVEYEAPNFAVDNLSTPSKTLFTTVTQGFISSKPWVTFYLQRNIVFSSNMGARVVVDNYSESGEGFGPLLFQKDEP
eukprot:TRINITY_DN8986_c0_g1_i1.p1 TRINITY_DN8986_c0_g1~~TRINITY_DN8986_c0_g1_i1.p1  ORF type:complete len:112 (+),score=4.04 TRINITY_DN8986_c0_g1_i1:609-944(+)